MKLWTPLGLPWNSVQAEQTVEVTKGHVDPDFYFVLTDWGDTFTISQHPETNSTWSETVTYQLLLINGNPIMGTIVGTGTLTFSAAANQITPTTSQFFVQATDLVTGRFHLLSSGWGNSRQLPSSGRQYPITSSRGVDSNASGTADSGVPY